jgi:hypothetical protein
MSKGFRAVNLRNIGFILFVLYCIYIVLYYSLERTCSIEVEMRFFNRGSSRLSVFLGPLNHQT